MRIAVLTAAAVLTVMLAPSAAVAADATATLKDFGLLGNFSKDCAQPVSMANSMTRYVAQADGTVALTYDSGSGGSSYTIHAASILTPTIIRLDEKSDAGGAFEVLLVRDGKRIRVIESRDPVGGRAFVSAGVITGNGRETQWETRCG
jgi:hypothetical protein